MAELTFLKYPHPAFDDRLITSKPEGMGWNNLGKRVPGFIVLHRILGSLNGTDAYFRDPNVPALTDYGIGVAAQDGDVNAGTIYRWCDPRGYVTPWASGPVSAPYGDGLCVLKHYGYYDAANKNGVSIEISGFQTTPIDAVAYRELVKLCAYWCDQMRIPYDRLTESPHTGCSSFVWHQEFTIGTGKECPFDTVMELTPRLIADVHDELVPYQTSGVAPAPSPEPKPEEDDPLKELAKSDYILDPNLVWEDASGGAVGKLWRDYGEATGIFNPPGQPWNDPIEGGGKLYCFEGGPVIATDKDGKARIVVKVK